MKTYFHRLFLASAIALTLTGCTKDPVVQATNYKQFATGQIDLAYFQMIDSGIPASGFGLPGTGAINIDMDGDSTADIALAAYATKSAASFSYQSRIVSLSGKFSFYLLEDLLYRHMRDTITYNGFGPDQDTIKKKLDYYDKDSTSQMGTTISKPLPNFGSGLRIDTLPSTWATEVSLKSIWQTLAVSLLSDHITS